MERKAPRGTQSALWWVLVLNELNRSFVLVEFIRPATGIEEELSQELILEIFQECGHLMGPTMVPILEKLWKSSIDGLLGGMPKTFLYVRNAACTTQDLALSSVRLATRVKGQSQKNQCQRQKSTIVKSILAEGQERSPRSKRSHRIGISHLPSDFWLFCPLQKPWLPQLDMSTAYHLEKDGDNSNFLEWKDNHLTLDRCRDVQLIGDQKIIHETTRRDSAFRQCLQADKDWQKSYAYNILKKVDPVAYTLKLPKELSSVHSTFHVSNLKKCLSDKYLIIPMKELQLDDKLNFVEEPVEIMDREIKQLRQRRIPIVKIYMGDDAGWCSPLYGGNTKARITKMEPDFENMTINEYLEYEAEMKRRLRRNVKSKRSPRKYEDADFDSFYRDESNTVFSWLTSSIPLFTTCSTISLGLFSIC
ncbi:hypothetical protein Tco_0919257 [Tanacetum coccineum]